MYQVETEATKCTTPRRYLGNTGEKFQAYFRREHWKKRLRDEILTTTFCLVEQSLHTRNLVLASADAADLDAFTPNYSVLEAACSGVPWNWSSDVNHRKRYAPAQTFSDAIQSRLLREYVPTLNRQSNWSSSGGRGLKTGDHLV